MIMQVLHCPHCQGTDIIRYGTTRQGKQRYRCQENGMQRAHFSVGLHLRRSLSRGRTTIIDMAMNASGIRDTARVLHVSPTTVIKELKKEPELQPVNHAVLAVLNPEQVEVEIWRAEDELEVHRGLSSELGEMWSYVADKAHPRWLWHAMDHHTGKVLAYGFGRRKDDGLLEAPSVAGTLWHHDVLHGRLGGLRAASRCRSASSG